MLEAGSVWRQEACAGRKRVEAGSVWRLQACAGRKRVEAASPVCARQTVADGQADGHAELGG